MDATIKVLDKPVRVYPPRFFDEGSEMPEEYRAAVIRLIVETGELGSTNWHQEAMRRMNSWVELAPTVADRVRIAELHADEMRHGYIFENLYLSLGEKIDPDGATTSIEGLGLAGVLETWEQVAVFTTLMDRAATFQFADYVNSSYTPLANVAPSVTLDEQGHAATGLLHLKEIVKTEGGRERAQNELNWLWPAALDMFGTTSGKRQFRNIEWGLRERTNEELRRLYIAHTRPLLEELNLEPPDNLANRKFL